MNEQKLIRMVKANPLIYDKRHQHFKHRNKKADAWEAVSAAVRFSVEDCQRAWNSIRSRYVKKRKRLSQLPSESVTDEVTWSLYDSLKFLDRHVHYRKTTGNYMPSTRPSYSSSCSEERGVTPTRSCSEASSRSNTPEFFIDKALTPSGIPSQLPAMAGGSRKGLQKKKEAEFDELLKKTITKLGEWLKRRSEKDSNHHFAMSLVPALRNLPEKVRIRAKIDILQVLDKYENLK